MLYLWVYMCYIICNYKNYLKIKYFIYETYNIIFNIWKFYTKYLNYLNFIIMKNNAILGHVDFFWNSLDITNKNIFHYLMSKNPKKIFI
jgi:hypothetical protein